MDRTPILVSCMVLILLVCALCAGCSDPATDPGTQPSVTTAAGPLYTEGDIVRNPSSAASNAWLVLGYDSASDTYERALVYPDTDGNWGYRSDSRTENAARSIMEKVYTEIVTNQPVSSIPIRTQTVATTATTSAAVTVTTTVAATATTSAPPRIRKIIPDKGDAGTTVQITDLAGDNFRNGANVSLSRAGANEIRATGVRAVTPNSITCTFDIPSDAPAGSYDVVVKNPDGQSDRYTNIFSVHRTSSALQTTSATSSGTVPITYIDPPFGHIGYGQFTITGSGFKSGATVLLQRDGSTDIEGTNVMVDSDTQIRCFLDLPSGAFGVWDVRVTNSDKTYGVRYDMLTVN